LRESAISADSGQPIIYTAQSLSLAALEILVHLKETRDVEPFRSYAAEIPDDPGAR
jgi:RES domain-containing protein